jgi:cobalamin biosynthesis protein CobT
MEMELDLPPPEMVASVEEIPPPMEETPPPMESEVEPIEIETEEAPPPMEETKEEVAVEETEPEAAEEETNEKPQEESQEPEPEEQPEPQKEKDQEEEQEPEKPSKPKVSEKEKAATKIVKKIDDKARYDDAAQMKTLIVMQILGNTKTFFDTQSIIVDTNVEQYLNKTIEDEYGILFNMAQDNMMTEMINGQY